MSDEFDPNWPHGHLFTRGYAKPCRARFVARRKGTRTPLVFLCEEDDGREFPRCFTEDGIDPSGGRLINAPAPVKHAEAWVNVYLDEEYNQLKIGTWWPSRDDAVRYGDARPRGYVGSIRISTETADIIGPNGEKVKL